MTRYYKFVLGSVLAIGVAGTAAAQTAPTPKRGGSLVISLAQDPTTLNPTVTTAVPDRQMGCIIFEGLVEAATRTYEIKPAIAKSWTVSPDGLSYDFQLNKVEWHDGKPVTSEDVKFTILEMSGKYSTIFRPAADAIESIDTPAPDRVVFKLKYPFGPFLISLTCSQGAAIMPAHLLRGKDARTEPASTSAPVGTGPFKFAEWKRGDYVKLVRNPKYYFEGRPYLDEVIGKVIPSPATRIQALQTGEIDFLQAVPENAVAALERNPNIKIVPSDTAPQTILTFINTERKPFDNKLVRQALFMALDRDYILKTAFFGSYQVGMAPFSTEIGWAANPDIDYRKMYPFNVAKANAMLDEAGVKRDANGKRFSVKVAIYSTQYTEFVQVVAAMKSMWAEIGVDVASELMEQSTLHKKVYEDADFDMSLNSYTTYADPALGVARTFVSSAVGRILGNGSRYKNPKVDELFAKGERSTDNAERGKYYKEVQAILAEDLPVFTLRQHYGTNGISKKVMGLTGQIQNTSGNPREAWINE